MVIFALFLLISMLIVAGMAVDFMRVEANRQRMQTVADRAVLAAASLDQTQDPETVVRDYFTKAGMGAFVDNVRVTGGTNQRSVTVDASNEVNMTFTRLLGVDDMNVPVLTAASEAETDLEIVLVLDVSGSMQYDDKLTYLQNAANAFVDTIFANDPNRRITIGIVPFAGQVNLPEAALDAFNVYDDPGIDNVNCLELPASAFTTNAISTTLPIPSSGMYDAFSSTSSGGYYSPQAPYTNGYPFPINVMCVPIDNNLVVMPTRDAETLHDAIDDLYAVGATSIHLGMRWGTHLLDPNSRSMAQATGDLVGTGSDARPFAYGRQNTRKIIVLMTDGENFEGDILNAGFRTGASPIWRAGNGRYSIYHATRGMFWRPDNASWSYTAYSSNGVVNLTWPEVWEDLRMQWVAYQLYGRALATSGRNGVSANTVFTQTMNMFRTVNSVADLNTALQQQCTLARGNGEIIYGIAFQAPAAGQAQIAQCASSPAHYYDAEGLEIESVFGSIANQIVALRLTQ